MIIGKATAFELPSGSRIEITSCEGKCSKLTGETSWYESVDLTKVTADGNESVICTIEYESDGHMALRVYDEDGVDPIFEKELSTD